MSECRKLLVFLKITQELVTLVDQLYPSRAAYQGSLSVRPIFTFEIKSTRLLDGTSSNERSRMSRIMSFRMAMRPFVKKKHVPGYTRMLSNARY